MEFFISARPSCFIILFFGSYSSPLRLLRLQLAAYALIALPYRITKSECLAGTRTLL